MPCKTTEANRKIADPRYLLDLQQPPKDYQVKYNVDLLDPMNWAEQPPQTTAKSWCIYDCKKMIMAHSKNID